MSLSLRHQFTPGSGDEELLLEEEEVLWLQVMRMIRKYQNERPKHLARIKCDPTQFRMWVTFISPNPLPIWSAFSADPESVVLEDSSDFQGTVQIEDPFHSRIIEFETLDELASILEDLLNHLNDLKADLENGKQEQGEV